MRIGLMISGSLDMITGGYIYDRQLVQFLRAAGHRVDVIGLPCRSYLDRLLQNPRLPLSRELNILELDVLLQDELEHPALIFLNRRLKSRGRFPIISIVHHLRSCEFRTPWQNRFYRLIEKRYLGSVDGFVFNSASTRRSVEQLVGGLRPSVVAHPCGSRLPAGLMEAGIKRRCALPGPLRLVFVGNLIRRKALHTLLDAMSALPADYSLSVVGDLAMDREYVSEIRARIQNAGLEARVSLLGPVSDDQLASVLSESQVLVVPSSYEGFGIAYLEGMAFGLPAIGTTQGGAAEVITQGRDGFLIAPGDSAALAGRLRNLNADRALLASLSLNALERFRSHPTWESTSQTILTFLESLVGTRS